MNLRHVGNAGPPANIDIDLVGLQNFIVEFEPTFVFGLVSACTTSQMTCRHAAGTILNCLAAPASSRSGTIHVEYLSAHMTCLCQVKTASTISFTVAFFITGCDVEWLG